MGFTSYANALTEGAKVTGAHRRGRRSDRVIGNPSAQ
jgi:hypothetical protein